MADAMEETRTKCGFFLKRKNRYCKMIPGKGKKYCGEHCYLSQENDSDSSRKRIPCPLDKNHTVFEDQLEKHLKKCNVTKMKQVVYYQANINSGLINEGISEEKLSLKKIPKSDIQACIDRINAYFNGNPLLIKRSIFTEDGLQNEIEKMNGNQSSVKHLQQQSSLIGNLRQSELLTPDTIFVEFGAGRGMLSHWVQKAVKDQSNVDFLLVDRASTRYKADSYHRGPDQGPSFNRIQIDIEHLNLSKVPLISHGQQEMTGISKHLCGAATDLALRCLLHTSNCDGHLVTEENSTVDDNISHNNRARKKIKLDTQRVRGLLFALCCHHRCSWGTYVGKEFFEKLGFTPYYFHILCCLSSWATCGSRTTVVPSEKDLAQGIKTKYVVSSDTVQGEDLRVLDNPDENIEHLHEHNQHDENVDEGSSIKALGLSKTESEELGRKSKHLIDAGRVWYLKNFGLEASLVYYVNSDVSLENVALLAWNNTHKT